MDAVSADPTGDNGYLACDACKAPAGRPCWARTGGGPHALPDVVADHPHGGRKRRAARRAVTPGESPTKPARTAVPVAARAARAAARRPSTPPAWLRTTGRP